MEQITDKIIDKPHHWFDDVLAFMAQENAYVCLESPYQDETWRCSISHRSNEYPDRCAMNDAATAEKAWELASAAYERQVAHEDALYEERSPAMKREEYLMGKADMEAEEGR